MNASESQPETQRKPQPDPRVLAALSGADAGSDRALALRTRRAVYTALAARRTDRVQERRSLLLALLLTGTLAIALAPALWAGVDELFGGGSLLELPGMLVALGITTSFAVAAVLLLILRDREGTPAPTRPPVRAQRRSQFRTQPRREGR